MTPLSELIRTKRIIVCVGSGGVGKTTTSAAIALRATALGRRVMVLTVDPAKRLANSLGIQAFTEEAHRVTPELLSPLGVESQGALYAMMLDTKSTFDRLIMLHAPNEAVRARILESDFYQKASTTLAGTHEFMAMEKLFELHQSGDYDLIVLDTPPTAHALDFLNAPGKLIQLLDNRSFRAMMDYSQKLGRVGFKVFNRNSYVLKAISKFIGFDFLVDLLTFLEGFNSMFDGFQRRAEHVRQILREEGSAFVVVCAPEPASVNDGIYFHKLLRRQSMPFGAFIVNRTHQWPAVDVSAIAQPLLEKLALEGPEADEIVPRIARVYEDYRVLSEVDHVQVTRLREQVESADVQTIPIFDTDIHDLHTLYQFGAHLVTAQPASSDSASPP